MNRATVSELTPWTVSELTRHIKALLDGDEQLGDLWLEGELSNFKRATSGHCYFTLKDGEAEIRCAMWRREASLLGWLPSQGDRVEAHGYVSVYERGGVYQFYADTLKRAGGIGASWLAFQELRARLEAEGLFATSRKRPLPAWPRRIGVVTSPSGAALRDILNVLGERYPLVEVVLSPSLVQGLDAPESLVLALGRLNQLDDLDVVIVARGGGSLEDLWAFNDERVARAIVACRFPVVSGVGHEMDFTIADFCADYRAPTPSAAAAAVVPDRRELLAQVYGAINRLADTISRQLDERREQLAASLRLLHTYDLRRALPEQRQRVDDWLRRATLAVVRGLDLDRAQLAGAMASLQALSPYLVLGRGYGVVEDRKSGLRIESVAQASIGQLVRVHLKDGSLGAEVTETFDRRQMM